MHLPLYLLTQLPVHQIVLMMGKILWISIRVGALLIMVVLTVIIVMKCKSAHRKKTLQESSVSDISGERNGIQ